jgi:hypothetical protein
MTPAKPSPVDGNAIALPADITARLVALAEGIGVANVKVTATADDCPGHVRVTIGGAYPEWWDWKTGRDMVIVGCVEDIVAEAVMLHGWRRDGLIRWCQHYKEHHQHVASCLRRDAEDHDRKAAEYAGQLALLTRKAGAR